MKTIVFVQVSKRRYLALACDQNPAAWRRTAPGIRKDDERGYVYGHAEVLAGPAAFTDCDRAAWEYAQKHGLAMTHAEHEGGQS